VSPAGLHPSKPPVSRRPPSAAAPPRAAVVARYGPPVTDGAWRDLVVNLQAGLRGAVLFAPPAHAWRPWPAQIALLALLDLCLVFLMARFEFDIEAYPNLWGVPRALLPATLALAAGLLSAGIARQPAVLATLATAVLAITVWFDLVSGVVSVIDARDLAPGDGLPRWAPVAVFVAWTVAVAVAALRLVQAGVVRRLGAAGWTAVVVALPMWWLPSSPLWWSPEPEESAEEAAAQQIAAGEETIYAQPKLIELATSRLSPQRAGVEDVYFVGVAGDAAEDVFLNEVQLAAQVIGQRFDADARGVLLVNNPKTVRTLPIASSTSLAATLDAVGRTLDPDEDVLVLFLTSHGSATHEFSLEFAPLVLDPVTPARLREMLDAAGIGWRVIVVSACYSGGYVAPLAGPRTLVITAADATHTSFGCGADSQLTWFGKAFFDEALPGAASLEAAFAQARDAIAAREKAQGYAPSNPQWSIGAEMAAKLARLEAARRGRVGDRAVGSATPSPSAPASACTTGEHCPASDSATR
jgi:hypothetical protein